jgi:hypothetical protein
MLKTVSTQLALASDTLPEVLAKGNTTGGTDLAVSAGDDITFADNSKAIFGAGSDISIYSDGSTGQVTGNVNVTGDATFSGSVGIGGAPTEKLDISQSVNNSVIAKVTNTNSGDLASARVEIHNDNSSFGQLTTYSSGFAYNVLGSNAANWTLLGSSGANSNGLKIGTLTADPVVFGTNDTERMRLDGATGQLSVPAGVLLGGTAAANLLDDYEEGLWTPTDVSGAGLSFTSVTGNYRKVGGIIFANFTLLFPATSDATIIQIGTLPYSSSFNNGSGGTATYTDYNSFLMLSMSTTLFRVYGGTGASIQNATLSGKYLEGFLVYPA